MKNITWKLLVTVGLLLTTIVYSEESSIEKKNIQKEREFIKQQQQALEKEYKIREKFLNDALKSLDKRENKFNGGCPNPPCKEMNLGGCPMPPCTEDIKVF